MGARLPALPSPFPRTAHLSAAWRGFSKENLSTFSSRVKLDFPPICDLNLEQNVCPENEDCHDGLIDKLQRAPVELFRKRTPRYSSGVLRQMRFCNANFFRRGKRQREGAPITHLSTGNNDLIVSSVTMNYLRSRMETSLFPRYACDMCRFKYYTDVQLKRYMRSV